MHCLTVLFVIVLLFLDSDNDWSELFPLCSNSGESCEYLYFNTKVCVAMGSYLKAIVDRGNPEY